MEGKEKGASAREGTCAQRNNKKSVPMFTDVIGLWRSSSDQSIDAARSLICSGARADGDRKAAAIGGKDRRTDTWPIHRPRPAPPKAGSVDQKSNGPFTFTLPVAEWLACWTQAQKGSGSNRSRDALG